MKEKVKVEEGGIVGDIIGDIVMKNEEKGKTIIRGKRNKR